MERNPVARINLDAKAMLNQKNYILKAQRLTAVKIDEIIENIRLEIGEATEDYTNEVNGDRTNANGIEYQNRDKENENTDCGKEEINKHTSAEREQHTVKLSAWSDGHCPHAARSHSFVYISTS